VTIDFIRRNLLSGVGWLVHW